MTDREAVFARDIWQALGYADWRNFDRLIQKAYQLIASGVAEGEIEPFYRVVAIGSGAMRPVPDYRFDAEAERLIKLLAAFSNPRRQRIEQ